MILIHRYPYGIRGIAGFAYGASSLSWPRFLMLNFVAAGVWSVATVGSGYAFGYVSEKIAGALAYTLTAPRRYRVFPARPNRQGK